MFGTTAPRSHDRQVPPLPRVRNADQSSPMICRVGPISSLRGLAGVARTRRSSRPRFSFAVRVVTMLCSVFLVTPFCFGAQAEIKQPHEHPVAIVTQPDMTPIAAVAV